MNQLHLTGSEVFSERTGEKGDIIDVRFFVYANEVATSGLSRVFSLRAMTDEAYAPWYMEEYVMAQSGEAEPFPLYIPTGNLGHEPLDEFVSRVYLDTKQFLEPGQPHPVNDIAQFLIPADGE